MLEKFFLRIRWKAIHLGRTIASNDTTIEKVERKWSHGKMPTTLILSIPFIFVENFEYLAKKMLCVIVLMCLAKIFWAQKIVIMKWI